jgi:hypothetical protein
MTQRQNKMNFDVLRKIARSVKYQNLYCRTKELNNIKIFNNDSDFSYIQSMFLYYLELYNSLYTRLAQAEENLNEDIIEDWIRTEAYLFWKEKNKNSKTAKNKQPNTTSENSVVFKRN